MPTRRPATQWQMPSGRSGKPGPNWLRSGTARNVTASELVIVLAVTPSRALLLVLAVVSAAALAGVLVGTSDSSSNGAARVHERLLAKAKPAPKLPTYEPGSAWPSLPPPP